MYIGERLLGKSRLCCSNMVVVTMRELVMETCKRLKRGQGVKFHLLHQHNHDTITLTRGTEGLLPKRELPPFVITPHNTGSLLKYL